MDNDKKTPWQYRPGGGSEASDVSDEEELAPRKTGGNKTPITWTASEYIDHEKGASWYSLLFVSTLALGTVIYLLTRDFLAAGTILILGVIIAVAARRRPQQVEYKLSDAGLKIGEKSYSFSSFRSFYIVKDGDLHSISLIPLKKFTPALSIFFDPADEKRITERLSEHLPYEEHTLDSVDRLARRLRF
jgi:hypothetical protein